MSDYLDPNNEELLKDYFSEAEMQLEALERNILVLETDPNNYDAVDEIFRAAHTLKGASATVQMNELTEFTHLVEDVLDDIRSGKIKITSDGVDILLQSLDVIKAMLGSRMNGSVYTQDISSVTNNLNSLKNSVVSGTKKAPEETKKNHKAESTPQDTSKTSNESIISEYELLELSEAASEDEKICGVFVQFNEDNPMNTVGGIQVFAALKQVGTILKTYPEFDQLYEDLFHPLVKYFISTNHNASELVKAATISDVTLEINVHELRGVKSSGSATSKSADVVPKIEKKQQTSDTDIDAMVAQITQDINNRGKVSEPISAIEYEKPPIHNNVQTKKLEEQAQTQIEPVQFQEAGGDSPDNPKKQVQSGGSVLRVESKRIDDLLNLVSETVINKATFNQVSTQFSESLSHLQQMQSNYRQLIKELFDSLPDYMEKIERGVLVKDVKKEIVERFGLLLTLFDGVQNSFKGSINKFRSTSQNLGRITSELQEGVMRIRMVPISQIFSRFPRLVRDLSKSLDKKINLKIEGEDTELDKSVIEDLLDPLIHCVRNSLDHGIESAKERKEAGKPEEGTLLLKASNEGNMILIEIYDDGKGINVEKVKQKAIERGIIHPNKVLTDVEAFNLIFEAGFSTATQVTNISGRGVGLDVVRKQIEKLNGNVSVTSTPNRGTRFTIKIPLTLAIIQGLLVKVGNEMYAIPITAVLDSHRIKPKDIRRIDNYEVFNVREDVISLMRLNRIFNIPSDENKEYYFVVIVGSGDKKMGLIVDQLIGEEDVVIKPLKDHYTNAPGIAGANITGDGTVSLIIDVSQLLDLGQKQEKEARMKREATTRALK